MPLNPAIQKKAREYQATMSAYTAPVSDPAPAWAMAVAIGTPLAIIAAVVIGMAVRGYRRDRNRRRLERDLQRWTRKP